MIGLTYITAELGNIIPPGHTQAKVLQMRSCQSRLRAHCAGSIHTTVMGIIGAFGKTKATSSNMPRRRQFWASAIHPAPLYADVV